MKNYSSKMKVSPYKKINSKKMKSLSRETKSSQGGSKGESTNTASRRETSAKLHMDRLGRRDLAGHNKAKGNAEYIHTHMHKVMGNRWRQSGRGTTDSTGVRAEGKPGQSDRGRGGK